MQNRVNVDQLLVDLRNTAEQAEFTLSTYGYIKGWPLYVCTRSGRDPKLESRQIYISAGIHGDEPAGPLALLELFKNNSMPIEHDYIICPLMNPEGLVQGSRENGQNRDLNRDYGVNQSIETKQHAYWADENIDRLDLALHLHEDWESHGFYLYELNFNSKANSKAIDILKAVKAHVCIETASMIDGHPAQAGIIRPEKPPTLPDGGQPEAIYFKKKFGGLNYTLEAPSSRKLPLRINALKAAVLAAIEKL